MDDYKIAVASSDGIVVNSHFGHAARFLIYRVVGDEIRNTGEVRNVTPACHMKEHDDARLDENMRTISDCKYLLVSRIGNGAAMVAEQYGISPMEIPLIIDDAIRKIIDYEKIQKLFERK